VVVARSSSSGVAIRIVGLLPVLWMTPYFEERAGIGDAKWARPEWFT